MFPAFIACALAWAELPADPVDAFAAARAVIEQQEAAIRSFDVEYEVEVKRAGGGLGSATRPEILRRFLREQRRGDRYRRDFDEVKDGEVPPGANRYLQTFDGSTKFHHGEINKTGFKLSKGDEENNIRHLLYFSRYPPVEETGLGEQLAAHKEDANVDWETVDGERLLAVSWDEDEDQGTTARRTFFLDPEAAWQPRRYTSETEYADGRNARRQLGIVQDYVRQDGFVWPNVVLRTFYEIDADNNERGGSSQLLTIKTVAFNPELDDAIFRIDFPEGTRVTDYDRNVEYIVGEPDSERPHVGANMLPPPPPYQLWSDWRLWLVAAAIGIGLIVGLLIWRKRR